MPSRPCADATEHMRVQCSVCALAIAALAIALDTACLLLSS
jgi:hypothetical protein